MNTGQVLVVVLANVSALFCAPGDASMEEHFTNIDSVQVMEGEATVLHVEEGHEKPGALAVSDVRGPKASVAIGRPFSVHQDQCYLLRVWMQPDHMRKWRARLVLAWTEPHGKHMEPLATPFAYTASSVPHVWKPMPPVWMEYAVSGRAPKDAVSARVLLRIDSETADGDAEAMNRGRLLFDDLLVTRTPDIEVTTGEAGNLIIEGAAFPVSVSISNMPMNVTPATLTASIRDLDDREVAAFNEPVGEDGLEKTVSYDLGRGYYEIRWRLARKDVTLRHGTVSAGVVPDPKTLTAGHDTPFALDAGFSWFYAHRGEKVLAEAAEVARRAGVKHLRERLHPRDVTREPGQYDWGKYLRAAKAQHDAGIQILEMIHSWPQWLANEETDAGPPKNLTGVYKLFNKAATDMGEYMPYWEPWNEVDIFFFKGRPEEFAGVQKAAYLGVLAANPRLKVTSGSTASGNVPWFRRALDNGIRDYFDIFNTHYYGKVDGVVGRLERDRRVNEQYCLTQPWSVSEMGMTCFWDDTGTFRASECAQADFLVKSFVYVLSQGVERFYHFYMAEFLESYQDMWGVCRYDLTPKPAFIALANMIGILDKGQCLGQFDLGVKGAEGYVFDNGGERVLVAWADKRRRVKLPGKGLRARDMVGRPVSSDILEPQPKYFLGVDIPDRALTQKPEPRQPYVRPDTKALSMVQMICGEVEADYPFHHDKRKWPIIVGEGKALNIHLTLCNFWDEPISVTSKWEIPDKWECDGENEQTIELRPWEEKVITRCAIPRELDRREYRVAVHSTAPTRTIAPVVMCVSAGTEND